jgi:phosphoserine phosphatase
MHQILLIRPGATPYDEQGRIQGSLDMPLSPHGEAQLTQLQSTLPTLTPVAIYSGPSQAAEQTAEVLGERWNLKHKVVDKLHNLDHGLWQGQLVDELKTKQPRVYRQWQEQPETVCPPQGETVLAAKARIAEALKKMLKKHKPGGVIVIVSQEPLASIVRHVLKLDELSGFWKSSEQCAKWELIDVPEGM